MKFKIEKSYDVQGMSINPLKVRDAVHKSLENYFVVETLAVSNDWLEVTGILKSWLEYANVRITLDITQRDEKLFVSADGRSCFNSRPWMWVIAGLFFRLLFLMFFCRLIQFCVTRRWPKTYLDDALEDFGTELRTSPDKFCLAPGEEKIPAQGPRRPTPVGEYENYEDVPFYRKNWFFTLWFFVFIPVAMFLLLAKGVYYEKDFKAVPFGLIRKILMGVIGTSYIIWICINLAKLLQQ
jgi:hypothetical protein